MPRDSWKKWVAACVVSLGFSLASGRAAALKVDTHVYVSQQVLNDVVDDGKVSITFQNGLTHSFPIDEGLVAALRQHPSYFRMGSIGPDAFPGVIGGQLVIHPGHEDPQEWGTGHWLHYLSQKASSPEEQAFSAGYRVHAATDTFAHTYVNHYSGDVWDLSGETHVEARHFILESFIGSKNPPLVDHQGASQGSATQAILNSSGQLAVPAEFVANAMIFSGESHRFADGAPHLAFLGKHERNIADGVETAEQLSIEIERLLLYYQTGILGNHADIKRLRELANDLKRRLIPVDHLKKVADEITSIRSKHVEIEADVLEDLLGKLIKAHSEWVKARQIFEDAALEAVRLNDRITNTVNICKAGQVLNDGPCKKIEDKCNKIGLGWLCKAVTKTNPHCIAEAQGVYRAALAACEKAQEAVQLLPLLSKALELRNRLETEALGLEDEVKSLVSEIETLMITQIELENQLLQASLDMIKLSQADINLVVAFYKSWRLGIRRAGVTYVVANGQAMVNVMEGKNPIDPLMKWLECHTLPIAGLPSPINDAACAIDGAKSEALNSLKRILETLGKIDPVSKLLLELINKLEKKIKAIVTETVVAALEEVTGEPVKELLEIIKQPGTVQAVTRVFTDGEAYNLRSIPDVAYRVAAEMRLSTGSPYFDPDRFAPVFNAIVLSKLALLSPEQLNELAKVAGVQGPTVYGPTLFVPGAKSSDVLTGALRSIDGSHQWFDQAMPFLRTWSHEHAPLGRYSYLQSLDTKNGFRFWKDPQAKDRVFRRVFRGPLVAGIDAPETIGFPPVLLSNYPYRVCEAHPWPDENDPNKPDETVDAKCDRAALTTLLSAFPDMTKEDIEAMRAVHKLLAMEQVEATFLTDPLEWACLSADRDSPNLDSWSLKFTSDGKVTGIIASRDGADLKRILRQAAIRADFELIGDFLFTTPAGAGYIEAAAPDSETTLLRRYTNHPQRYWVQRDETDSRVYLWNQDGTRLACEARKIPAAANIGATESAVAGR